MKKILGKGITDPHIRIFNNRAYLYASHDLSPESKEFIMPDWWIWSSDDLVNWQYESTLKPEETYIGEASNGCWATDAIERNGKYYWYFSDVRDKKVRQIGVVVGDHPAGPWRDALGKPMISYETGEDSYDPTVFQEEDGTSYIVYGAFNYYIAKLSEDMISLAEQPRKIEVINPVGPYGESTDDKVFLHKRDNLYYLSWGCFYAIADNIYGPYDCKGSIICEDLVEEGFKTPTWPHGLNQGRHGSFFEWHNQWYFTYCDISQGDGNRYYRDSWISYVHYKNNGEIAPIVIDSQGVGQYDGSKGRILASNYFKANNAKVVEGSDGQFEVLIESNGACIAYPNMHKISQFTQLKLKLSSNESRDFAIEVIEDTSNSEILGTIQVNSEIQDNYDFIVTMNLENRTSIQNISLKFVGEGALGVRLSWFEFCG